MWGEIQQRHRTHKAELTNCILYNIRCESYIIITSVYIYIYLLAIVISYVYIAVSSIIINKANHILL